MAVRVLGVTIEDAVVDHANRVRQEAEDYGRHLPARLSVKGDWGGGISRLGEFYRGGHGQSCPGPAHCRADATVAKNRRETVPE